MYDYILPDFIYEITGQRKCKFGLGYIKTIDLSYSPEICEELWMPYSPSTELSLFGVEIIGNSSGSHFQINKQERRYELIVNSSKKNGGVYLYSNLIGCDGGRLYFDGGSFITMNGNILNEGKRFSLDEIEVITCNVDLNEVESYRNSIKSRCEQSSSHKNKIPYVFVDVGLCDKSLIYDPFYKIKPKTYTYEEEMAFAPACWLWDYLRRSGASGFFLPLSGGADSGSVCIMVSLLTKLLYNNITEGKCDKTLLHLRKIINDNEYYPKSAYEICNLILVTCYMGTDYSSDKTNINARDLAEECGAHHLDINIQNIYDTFKQSVEKVLNKSIKFQSENGSYAEDLALQNIQARIRMCVSYMLSALVNWSRNKKGFLLVLASGNLDEGLMGYLTKYDCSSADIN